MVLPDNLCVPSSERHLKKDITAVGKQFIPGCAELADCVNF